MPGLFSNPSPSGYGKYKLELNTSEVGYDSQTINMMKGLFGYYLLFDLSHFGYVV